MSKSILLKVAMAVSSLVFGTITGLAYVGQVFQFNDLYYEVTADSSNERTVEVVSYATGTKTDLVYQFPDGELKIPAEVTSPSGLKYVVTSIGIAFGDCLTLKSVVIPGSVKEIDYLSFKNCLRLASVTLEDSSEELFSDGNWLHCIENLENLYIGRNLVDNLSVNGRITISCYEGSMDKLKTVEIGDPVTSKYAPSLYQLPGLTSVSIGKGMDIIPEVFIYECPNLTNLTIPATVKEIVPFSCVRTPLETLNIEDSPNDLLINWSDLDNFDATRLENLYFGRNNTGCCVWHNSPLKNVEIGNMVTVIPSNFMYSPYIKEIKLGESVKIIDRYAFSGPVLENIILNEGLEEIRYSALSQTGIKLLSLPSTLRFIDEYTLPEKLKEWNINGDNLVVEYNVLHEFSGDNGCFSIPACVKGINVRMPNVTKLIVEDGSEEITQLPDCSATDVYIGRPIAPEIYRYEGALNTLTLGGCMRDISESAFSDCENLKTLRVDEGIETICEDAFYNTTNLATIHLPSTLKKIEDVAFWFTNKVQDIYIAATVPPVFEGTPWDLVNMYASTLYVPTGCKELYENSDWKSFNIKEYDVNGVEMIEDEDGNVGPKEYYHLDGTSLETEPEKGIYIERANGAAKIIMK